MKDLILSTADLEDFLKDGIQMDRLWRLVLDDNHPENHHLRGKDYFTEKERLEQEKKVELGYGFIGNTKLNT